MYSHQLQPHHTTFNAIQIFRQIHKINSHCKTSRQTPRDSFTWHWRLYWPLPTTLDRHKHLPSNSHFPDTDIRQLLADLLAHYKSALQSYSKALYTFLQQCSKHRTPMFYGLPKVHKNFTRLPPIISSMNSLLSASAMFLDFLLKPLAQLYLDYLHNSTSLILTLHNLVLPSDLQLITVDVVSLYHSIPQSECIDIIYQELCSHSDNLLFANYMTSVSSHILQLFYV